MYVFLNQAGLTFYPEDRDESAALRLIEANLKVGVPPELQGGGSSGSAVPVLDSDVSGQEPFPRRART